MIVWVPFGAVVFMMHSVPKYPVVYRTLKDKNLHVAIFIIYIFYRTLLYMQY